MSDDLTTKRAAAEAAGMRLPLTMHPATEEDGAFVLDAAGYRIADVSAPVCDDGNDLAVGAYLVAAANAAPGLAAEVERLLATIERLRAGSLADAAEYGQAVDERDAARAEVERLRNAVQAWRNWSDDVAPPWGSPRDRSDAGQRAFISAEVARLTQERDDQIALLRAGGDELQKACDAQVALVTARHARVCERLAQFADKLSEMAQARGGDTPMAALAMFMRDAAREG